MRTNDVLKVYGTYAEIARVLGVSRQATHSWGEIVPEGKAARLAHLSGGRLRYKPELYHGKSGKTSKR